MAIALRTLAQMEANVRTYIKDAANDVWTQPLVWDAINRNYARLFTSSQDRTQQLTATDTGLIVTAGIRSILLTLNSVAEIFQIFRASDASSFDGPELERMDVDEIVGFQDSEPTQAAPTKCGVDRNQRLAPGTAATFMRIWFHPIPDAGYNFCMRARIFVEQMTASAQKPDCTDEEQSAIEVLAALELGGIMGHDELYLGRLERMLPPRLQAIAKQQAKLEAAS